jgi:hypothetical protein
LLLIAIARVVNPRVDRVAFGSELNPFWYFRIRKIVRLPAIYVCLCFEIGALMQFLVLSGFLMDT